jgi:hypothetical protein
LKRDQPESETAVYHGRCKKGQAMIATILRILLIVCLVHLCFPTPSLAYSSRPLLALEQFGITGIWAVDCSIAPSEFSRNLVSIIAEDKQGRAIGGTYIFVGRNWINELTIIDAHILNARTIELRSGVATNPMYWSIVNKRRDGRTRLQEAGKIDGKTSVHEGINVVTHQETPPIEKCRHGDAASNVMEPLARSAGLLF